MDPLHPDFVPSVFTECHEPKTKQKQKLKRYERAQKRVSNVPDPVSSVDELNSSSDAFHSEASIQTDSKFSQTTENIKTIDDYKAEIALLKAEIVILKNNLVVSEAKPEMKAKKREEMEDDSDKSNKSEGIYSRIENNDELMNFYTGLPNNAVFEWYLSLFIHEIKYQCTLLSPEDNLLVILMKLKLGLLNKDLAFRFGVSETQISRIYRHWVPVIAKNTQFLIIWPERGAIRRNLPHCFKRRYKNCTCIIDCTEIFIERPLNLNARAQTFSNYKNTNTIKYLVGITPSGAVSFLSPGWGGRTSDKVGTNS